MKFFSTVLLSLSCLLAVPATHARAEIRLPAFFSDHMVLQAMRPVPIWGTATPNSRLTVEFDGKSLQTTVDSGGQWRAVLPSMPDNTVGRTLRVTGDGECLISDVLVGQVWLCSGQSNMGFKLAKANGGEQAIAASEDPLLRSFDVRAAGSPEPQVDCEGTWKLASPQTSGSFSAVAYFFARQLRRELKMPIGIIHASVGGTPIEAWSRRGELETIPSMAPVLKEYDAKIAATPNVGEVLRKSTPGWLFNGYIHPLLGYAIRGFVWYQGESNVDNAWQYRTLFPSMIEDWRQLWGDKQLPFMFAQIAARDSKQDESVNSPTAELREAQSLAEALPNTYMAVTLDTRAADWHPAEKEIPGVRLANGALLHAYGRLNAPAEVPHYEGMERGDDNLTIYLRDASGLKAIGDTVEGFTIADASRQFVPAQAKIVGPTVEVWAEGIARPVAVRYGWARGPYCNVVNDHGLPLAPFRSDDWPGATGPK